VSFYPNGRFAPGQARGLQNNWPQSSTPQVLARFYEKAARFQQELQQIEAGQCLYRGLMTALGYSHNQEPFKELADRIPLDHIGINGPRGK